MTKTEFCMGLQCPRQLWLHINRPDLEQTSIDSIASRNGREVGAAARDFFRPDAIVRLGEPGDMVEETRFFMDHGAKVIAEASFMSDEGFCSVDIFRNLGDKKIKIYEVKSSKEIKDIYKYDVAYQYRILTGLGFDVVEANIVTVNGEYVRHGEVNLGELFKITDITEEVKALQSVVGDELQVLSITDEPEAKLGDCCFKPYSCGFFDYCTESFPHPNVFDVTEIHNSTKFKYIGNNIISFEDLETSDLKDKYLLQVQHEIHDLPPHIDYAGIKGFLEKIHYPLFFLDFETVNPAIPIFDNSGPYDHIVFQYSLHYIAEEGLMHDEFLAMPGKDPRREVAERLCRVIPRDACVIVYNKTFEQSRLKELAKLYPDLSEKLLRISDNIVDLMEPFKKRYYYARDMKGSASIKKVLPAVFPDDPKLNYANLGGVHVGTEASEAYYLMAHSSPEELEELRSQLLKYCGLDTLATVKLLEFLQGIVCEKN